MINKDTYKIQLEGENTIHIVDKDSPHIAPYGTYTGFFQKVATSKEIQQKLLEEFRSLPNLGNTCYMNVILQCLLHTPLFSNYLVSGLYMTDLNNKEALSTSLAQLATVYKRKTNVTSELRNFRAALGKALPEFAPAMQHDALEFLCSLLDKLKTELTKEIPKKEENKQQGSRDSPKSELNGQLSDTKETKIEKTNEVPAVIELAEEKKTLVSTIDILFTGKITTTAKCSVCNNETKRDESFFSLNVPIPDVTYVLNSR